MCLFLCLSSCIIVFPSMHLFKFYLPRSMYYMSIYTLLLFLLTAHFSRFYSTWHHLQLNEAIHWRCESWTNFRQYKMYGLNLFHEKYIHLLIRMINSIKWHFCICACEYFTGLQILAHTLWWNFQICWSSEWYVAVGQAPWNHPVARWNDTG